MTTRRMAARSVEEEGVNEEVPPQGGQALQGVQVRQGEQVPIVGRGNEVSVVLLDMTNEEIRETLIALAQAITTQGEGGVGFIPIEGSCLSMEHAIERLGRYSPSLVCNPRDEMSRFVTVVADLVNRECHTSMLHNDMNLSRFMVYSKSIENSKLNRISRYLKRDRSDEQNQPRFKMRAPNQDEPSAPKVKLDGGVVLKDGPKVNDCPTIAARGREAKKVHPNALDVGQPNRNHFYVLQAKANLD
ncbi:hypothetical protein EJD97_016480 [Solanum chilense]|uniref:Uncharacterized protein n=1 Tax=Solanum chilense TaxID=4083 RepID=A0A6N2B9Q7_SOLCI|nr:hypothetical protein EJD97_016480 [Solanum chilense]